MAKREYHVRCQCGYPGCTDFGNYVCETRAGITVIQRRYYPDKWRCLRHNNPDSVLAIENLIRTTEYRNDVVISERGNDIIGLFWNGKSGFEFGPGFKAWSKDFPEGTILRVTAEILLP
jgi:hypothetical protein